MSERAEKLDDIPSMSQVAHRSNIKFNASKLFKHASNNNVNPWSMQPDPNRLTPEQTSGASATRSRSVPFRKVPPLENLEDDIGRLVALFAG